MRVLYTHSSSLIGGGNKVLLRLFEGLDRRRFQPISVIPEPGPIDRELRRLDVPSLVLDIRPHRWRRGALPALTARLAMWALRNRVQLLHANDPWTYRAASLGLSLPWIRRICHVHHPLQGPEALRWSLQRRPRLIITPSHFMCHQVTDQLGPDRPVRTEAVWNPIDVEKFQQATDVATVKDRLGLDSDLRNITIIGAVAPHKGHECFLRMASIIRRQYPNVRFNVVGSAKSGNQQFSDFLKRMVKDLDLEDCVRFWGFVSDKTVQDLLGISDLFVLPSREEGFGLTVAEAQACKVPVLASAISPLDEVVDNGRTGYLIPPADHEQFAVRAVQLLHDNLARRRMGEAGRRWVLSRFSDAAFVRRVTQLYDEVVDRGPSPGHLRTSTNCIRTSDAPDAPGTIRPNESTILDRFAGQEQRT